AARDRGQETEADDERALHGTASPGERGSGPVPRSPQPRGAEQEPHPTDHEDNRRRCGHRAIARGNRGRVRRSVAVPAGTVVGEEPVRILDAAGAATATVAASARAPASAGPPPPAPPPPRCPRAAAPPPGPAPPPPGPPPLPAPAPPRPAATRAAAGPTAAREG